MAKVRSNKRFTEKHRANMSRARKEGYVDKIVNNAKLCPKCHLTWHLTMFCKSSKRTNGYQLWCKNCNNREKKKSYHKYRKKRVQELARNTQLKKYGLDLGSYQEIWGRQKGVCAICGEPERQKSCPDGAIDKLRVDHCHDSGKVRGLLCSKCNFGIGQFQDDTSLLKSAIKYLDLHELLKE